ncbi:HotDog domain-containing protein [Hypoxylon trugodes]|uniref:HotDog domain-containing protein n=1 Tax=Hypoxylon trugodes TaxID=326681 RepID=UPI0021988EF3|nr:HotDog domain-containing protein [Hypoxylon trugodes]KAI1390195.1 HotDog domain-containing protein [Hypoxylon trugodes]
MANSRDQAKFEAIPWCAALIHAPDVVTFVVPSRIVGESIEPRSQDQLFRRTLQNDDAIPNCLGFYQDPKVLPDDGSPFLLSSSSILFDLRPGINGFNATAHGGLIAALMDESMGSYLIICDQLHKQKKAKGLLPATSEGFDKLGFATSRMDVRLRKAIKTPQIVVVTTHLAETNGRKVHFRVEAKGQKGEVYATCDGTWTSFPRGKL